MQVLVLKIQGDHLDANFTSTTAQRFAQLVLGRVQDLALSLTPEARLDAVEHVRSNICCYVRTGVIAANRTPLPATSINRMRGLLINNSKTISSLCMICREAP
jgi:hypothetical protein